MSWLVAFEKSASRLLLVELELVVELLTVIELTSVRVPIFDEMIW
jgi:hypothetical protein